MKILSFEDWEDKYYVEPDDIKYMSGEDADNEAYSQYETYISDYEDIAYEEYKDRQLFDED